MLFTCFKKLIASQIPTTVIPTLANMADLVLRMLMVTAVIVLELAMMELIVKKVSVMIFLTLSARVLSADDRSAFNTHLND